MWIKVSIHPYSVIKHFKELQLFIVIIESIIIYVKMTLPEHVFFREVKMSLHVTLSSTEGGGLA